MYFNFSRFSLYLYERYTGITLELLNRWYLLLLLILWLL